MKKFFFLYTIIFGSVVLGATLPEQDNDDEVELPEYAQTCEQDDPERDICIKNSIQSMLPRLHKGLKSLNIPPLDPFIVENNRFDFKNGGVQGSLALKGVKVYGATRTQIKDVRTEITDDGMTAEFDLYLPRVFIEGNYKADVNLNDLKLNPRGYFNVSMTDINLTEKMSGAFEEIKGKIHLRMNKIDVIPDIGNMKIYASGLFPDPQLNAFVLDFVNQYWPEMYKMMIPETRQYWEPIALDMINQFLLRVPFDKMLTKGGKSI